MWVESPPTVASAVVADRRPVDGTTQQRLDINLELHLSTAVRASLLCGFESSSSHAAMFA